MANRRRNHDYHVRYGAFTKLHTECTIVDISICNRNRSDSWTVARNISRRPPNLLGNETETTLAFSH